MRERSDGLRAVTRTPATTHLHTAPHYLRGADVILLVRDGRSVAASFAAAWDWPLDRATAEWRRGARRIIDLQRARPDDTRLLLVRYEDVLADLETAVSELLAFTGLAPDGFDRDRAAALPVLGSSFDRDDDGRVTWEPRPATPDFDPTRRFADWTQQELMRFEWMAGSEQRALGYTTGCEPIRGVADRARMFARDVAAPVRNAPWTVRRHAENSIRSARIEWRARHR